MTFFVWLAFEVLFNLLQYGNRAGAKLLINRRLQYWLSGLSWVGFVCVFGDAIRPGFSILAYSGLRIGLGCGFILLCLLYRWYAIQVLGRFYTATISIFPDHKIVEAGPYKLFRHPQHFAESFAFVALACCFQNYFCQLLTVLFPLVSAVFKVKLEEKALLEHFGEKYLNYQRRTYRIIPYIY